MTLFKNKVYLNGFYAALQKFRTVKSIKGYSLGLGEDLFRDIQPYDSINFKTLLAGNNIVLSSSSDSITISGPAGSGEANTASNLGTGSALFESKSGVDLKFKSIIAGSNITIVEEATAITINGPASSGEANTASNLGSGIGLFSAKSGVDLRFKSISTSSNIAVSSDSSSITLTSPDVLGNNKGPQVGQNIYDGNLNGTTLSFRRLIAGSEISLISGSDTVMIAVTGVVGATGVNQGSQVGQNIFNTNIDRNTLSFRRLLAGTGIGLLSGSDTVMISFTGSSGLTSSAGINLTNENGLYAGNSDLGTLQFRTLVAGSGVNFISSSNSLTIFATITSSGQSGVTSSIGINVGTGQGLYKGNSDLSTIQLRTLLAGSEIALLSGSDTVMISVTGTVGATGINQGPQVGQNIFNTNVDRNTLSFRRLLAGAGITLVSGSDTVMISFTGSISTGTLTSSAGINLDVGQGLYAGNSDLGTLQFRTLIAGQGIGFVSGSQNLTISFTGSIPTGALTSSTGVNLSVGQGLYNGNSDLGTLQFRTLIAGTGIGFISGSQDLTILFTGSIGLTSSNAVNLGSGEGLYAGNSDLGTLQFRTLVAGQGINFLSSSNGLTIFSTITSSGITSSSGINSGFGQGLYKGNSDLGTLQFRTIIVGTGLGFVSGSDTLMLSYTGAIGITSSSGLNMGPSVGQNVYDGNSDSGVLRFRRLLPGIGMGLISGSDTIMISFTGSAGSGITSSIGVNTGVGEGLYKGNSDLGTLQFRTLVAGTNIGLVSGSDSITIQFTGSAGVTGASYILLGSDASLTNNRTLTGTINQITITDNGAGSSVVLSLPQDISPSSSPVFNNITISQSSTFLNQVNISGNLNFTGSLTGYSEFINFITGNYQILPTDAGKTISFNSGINCLAILPTGLNNGFSTTLIQEGSGSVILSASGGVSLYNRQGHTQTAGVHAMVSLIHISGNLFIFAGDTA